MSDSECPHGPADRLPPLPLEELDPQQRAAADELIAGPRKAVVGPFIPLLRSPVLLTRVEKVGEYLRFHSALSPRVTEIATLIVARHGRSSSSGARTCQRRWRLGHNPRPSLRCAKA